MKVQIVGKNTRELESLVRSFGPPAGRQEFEIVNSNLFESEPEGSIPQSRRPDVIITYGGDGTLLSAERQFPFVPKLPLRNSDFCNKCSKHPDEIILQQLLDGKLDLKEHKKLETEILFKKFYALNDFVIRNSVPTHTIRFKMTIPSHPERAKRVEGLLIGDGIVVSTPFGSTGYFKSISQQTFKDGFGIAFNNTTERIDPLFLKDGDSVRFSLIRGKATLSFDNSLDIFNIDEGSELIFKLSNQTAKIYEDTSLRCPNCEVIRG